ncbi:hypothetical protein ELY33_08530 [Vreelandella andesensis]|uniref:Uncharacterized protein n=1 Tax=Vreelandella andesensis TaxID=447567 RepID=A0A433KMI4_9GAMM|nr:hypothetical protein [Halomonas andesensis]RUR30848.1 hypothetical protein ELY33_08530 [Halomonas andesensis]
MVYSATLLKRRQWHTLNTAAHCLSMMLSEEVTVAQVVELAQSGDIPIFVELSMPAWRLVEIGTVPEFHLSFSVQEHPVPHSPLLGMKVDTADTDCVLMGKYQLQIPSTFAQMGEWYVKDPDNDEAFIPGHRFRSLPSGKSFPERPARPAPEEWLFKRDDLESFASKLRSEAGEGEKQHRSSDEVKALEALGLLTEVIAYTGTDKHKYQWGEKPNCTQIAKAMETQAGNVSGMSEEKLKRLLGEALAAYAKSYR